jgi:hypothetical protein
LARNQWVKCDSNYIDISGAKQQLFKPEEEGNYAVILYKEGCVDTSDCIYFAEPTATDLQQKRDINIVPNPNMGQFKVINVPTEWNNRQYRIYNMQGQLIETGYIKGDKELELFGHPSGIYYLQLENELLKIVKY